MTIEAINKEIFPDCYPAPITQGEYDFIELEFRIMEDQVWDDLVDGNLPVKMALDKLNRIEDRRREVLGWLDTSVFYLPENQPV